MHVAALRTHRLRMFTSAALFWQEHVHEKNCEVPLQMLIDSSPASQSCFSCPCSCQIRAGRWVSRTAACVVWGPSDVRSAGYWQKASCGFEPRSLDSQSRVLTVTPRHEAKSNWQHFVPPRMETHSGCKHVGLIGQPQGIGG
jgi:hypothetical protein